MWFSRHWCHGRFRMMRTTSMFSNAIRDLQQCVGASFTLSDRIWCGGSPRRHVVKELRRGSNRVQGFPQRVRLGYRNWFPVVCICTVRRESVGVPPVLPYDKACSVTAVDKSFTSDIPWRRFRYFSLMDSIIFSVPATVGSSVMTMLLRYHGPSNWLLMLAAEPGQCRDLSHEALHLVHADEYPPVGRSGWE